MICLLISNAVSLTSSSYAHFLIAMTSLGLAWNFILISTTHLLPRTYTGNERAKIQGATDFLIFSFGALGSLLAGFAFCYAGWYSVNVAGLATGIVILVVMFLLRHSMNESPAEKAAA